MSDMHTISDPNAFLMGSGSKSASLKEVGDLVAGTITNLELRQQTDLKTREPKFWSDGKPMMQLVVTLATDEREDNDDDGNRNVYVKGSMKYPSIRKAIADAVAAAGAKGLEEGGILKVAVIGHGESGGPGLSAPTHYAAQYAKPVMPVGGFDPFASTPAPAAPQTADPFGAAPAAPAAPAAAVDPFGEPGF